MIDQMCTQSIMWGDTLTLEVLSGAITLLQFQNPSNFVVQVSKPEKKISNVQLKKMQNKLRSAYCNRIVMGAHRFIASKIYVH